MKQVYKKSEDKLCASTYESYVQELCMLEISYFLMF